MLKKCVVIVRAATAVPTLISTTLLTAQGYTSEFSGFTLVRNLIDVYTFRLYLWVESCSTWINSIHKEKSIVYQSRNRIMYYRPLYERRFSTTALLRQCDIFRGSLRRFGRFLPRRKNNLWIVFLTRRVKFLRKCAFTARNHGAIHNYKSDSIRKNYLCVYVRNRMRINFIL